tara:strand:+ start:2210 stop:2320 length:111 start_codon:yes stop_codon:yes gene_type:complete
MKEALHEQRSATTATIASECEVRKALATGMSMYEAS